MGFSVNSAVDGLEYSGGGLNGYFAQRSNVLSIKHWKMLYDIMRFNRDAPKQLKAHKISKSMTLEEFLNRNEYGEEFIHRYLLPMGAAIWSTSIDDMLGMPVHFFVQFFKNHGLLQVKNRPQWFVIDGGSRNYIAPMLRSMKVEFRLNTAITRVRHNEGRVEIVIAGVTEYFDEVIFACHSDQALALVEDVSADEKGVLENMPYEMNEVVLHTDTSLLPKNKRAWSSWNYHVTQRSHEKAVLTYNMNILQSIQAPVTFCVSLNNKKDIAPEKILASFDYAHPVFGEASISAQQKWNTINGQLHRWYCGAYWRNGFHEDGVVSALWVVNGILKSMGKPLVKVLGDA